MKPTHLQTPLRAFLLALAFVSASLLSSAQSLYRVREISPAPDFPGATYAHGINNANQVVGHSLQFAPVGLVGGGVRETAFVWNNGFSEELTGLGGALARALSINDAGQIVGVAGDSAGVAHPVLWQNHTMVDLGSLSPGYDAAANFINAEGLVIGSARNATGTGLPVYWQNGQIKQQSGSLSINAVNGLGHMVGSGSLMIDRFPHPSLALPGAIYCDGGMNGTPTIIVSGEAAANAINMKDTVVGGRILNGVAQAFTWRAGTVNWLPVLYRGDATANAVNNLDTVVGESGGRAVLWQYVGKSAAVSYRAHDLNHWIAPSSGWTLREAVGITDSGVIVGNGTHNGKQRAFLLIPVTM